MVNYFKYLIYNFADLAAPIVKLTKKDVPFTWSQDCQNAFKNSKT